MGMGDLFICLYVYLFICLYVYPQYMSVLFTKISQLTSYNLRNIAADLWLPQKRSSSGMKSFSYMGARTWNSFPTICKQVMATRDFESCV